MKKVTQGLLSLLVSSSLFIWITSCKKDTAGNGTGRTGQLTCKLDKVIMYDINLRPDTFVYAYSGDLITRLESPDHSHTDFDYQDTNVIRKTTYISSDNSSPYEYDTIIYNQAGQVAKIETFRKTGTSMVQVYRVLLEYTNEKLSKVTTNGYEEGVINPYAAIFDYTFTGNNITKMVYTDNLDRPLTYTYTYDTKENYFLKQTRQPWFTDLFFSFFLYGPIDLPLYMSQNNVTQIDYYGSVVPVIYKTDDKGNLLQWSRYDYQRGYTYACS